MKITCQVDIPIFNSFEKWKNDNEVIPIMMCIESIYGLSSRYCGSSRVSGQNLVHNSTWICKAEKMGQQVRTEESEYV